MNKLWPKVESKLPAAKKDHKGKLISEPRALKNLLVKEYKERLRARPVRPDLINLEARKNQIFQLKLKLASANKSKLWTMADLETALGDLKTNRSRDPEGLINEIFKKNVIGNDLKESLLLMFNNLKLNQLIPILLNYANITTVHKKGSRLLLVNERGIFRVPVLRSILMRLIYNDKYPEIDSNMSDGQMGGRKHKGCRNNILIINGVIHDVLSSKKKKPVLLQIYDYQQMFDAIELKEALSDIYDVGINDDNLPLIYNANNDVRMAVNTPNGLTERQSLENVVLQGDTFGSILASVQVDSIAKNVEKSGYGYKYKDMLPVGLLSLVDDMIGITTADFRAQQLSAVINVKTAEKRLQFGVTKCKSMLVGKNCIDVINSDIVIDKWSVKHTENAKNADNDLVEEYDGKVAIGKTENQKYLGFILSNKGDNMKNITEMKNKSVWIINKIFNRLHSLNLKKYFFECGIIFLNVMLRSSILYASETYYDLKEIELRALERIEEKFLRKLIKTSKGCPISQLYLEVGHKPARFEIFRIRLLFLKNILHEEDSRINSFIKLQLEYPTKGDWMSSCLNDIKYLDIKMSLEEIKKISLSKFKDILEKSINKKALEYLLQKRGSKGSEMKYSCIKMAEYLRPNEEGLSISDQRYIFSIRNRMVPISENFPNIQIENICSCGQIESMRHIYTCKNLNSESETISYEKIFDDNVKNQKQVYTRFKQNFETREKMKNENNSDHGIPQVDPLSLALLYSNGNE